MRYAAISGIMLLAMYLTATVFVQAEIFGVQINLLLLCVAVMTLVDGTLTPTLIGGGAAFFMDCIFARCAGFYTAPMLCAGLFAFLFGSKFSSRIPAAAAVTGGGAWFVSEIASMLLCIFTGQSVEIGRRMINVTLPGLFIHALLAFLLYFVFRKLCSRPFMKPSSRRDEDISLIRR